MTNDLSFHINNFSFHIDSTIFLYSLKDYFETGLFFLLFIEKFVLITMFTLIVTPLATCHIHDLDHGHGFVLFQIYELPHSLQGVGQSQ